MTFGSLIEATTARLRAASATADTAGFRSSAKKFLQLAGLSASSECTDEHLSNEAVRRTREAAERAGTLAAGGSAAWESRVKQLVKTWESHKARQAGAEFALVLKQGLKTSGREANEVARASGLLPPTFRGWLEGQTPSEYTRPNAVRLDAELELKGRLVATLSGLKLRTFHRVNHSAEELAAIKTGNGTLHATARLFIKGCSATLKPLLQRAGLRRSLADYFGRAALREYGPRLIAADEKAIAKLDKLTGARGLILQVFKKQLAVTPSPAGALAFVRAKWSPRLRAEYEKLCDYKTHNSAALDRTRKGRWTSYVLPDGRRITPSERKTRTVCEEVFGYALRHRLVENAADLRLAHVTVPEWVIGCTVERMKRRKRETLNWADRNFLGQVFSLINGGFEDEAEGRGYFANDAVGKEFWPDPFFEPRLPREWLPIAVGGYRIQRDPIAIAPANMAGRWQAYLAEANRKLHKFENGQTFSEGDYAESIQHILSDSDFDIRNWIKDGFLKLVENAPPRKSSPVAWAEHVRKCVLFLLMCTRGFRRTTHFRLETKHVVWNAASAQYFYEIPGELAKTRGKGGSKGGVHAAVDDVMNEFDAPPVVPTSLPAGATALLDVYYKHARPLLGIKTTSFYGWNDPQMVNTTFKRTCLYCLGRKVPPHAFRYLIATWCKREGIPVEQAATILGHLPSSTTTIYDKTTAVDRGRESNATLRRLFKGKAAA